MNGKIRYIQWLSMSVLVVFAGALKGGGCLGSVVPGLLGGEFSMVVSGSPKRW